jgi:hypothetical protein
VELESCTETACGNDLGWTAAGQWFKYTYNYPTAGTYTVSFREASPNGVTDAKPVTGSSIFQNYVLLGTSTSRPPAAGSSGSRRLSWRCASAVVLVNGQRLLPGGDWATVTATFTQIVGSAGYTFNPATGNTVTVSLPSGTSTQYVQLNFTANTGWDAAQLRELQIYRG